MSNLMARLPKGSYRMLWHDRPATLAGPTTLVGVGDLARLTRTCFGTTQYCHASWRDSALHILHTTSPFFLLISFLLQPPPDLSYMAPPLPPPLDPVGRPTW